MTIKVRLKDIARDLGISAMAVSKALRNHHDIGEETKARVRRRAAELDYRVDWVARSMVTGRTFLVGLVVPDLKQSFFAEIATALAGALSPAGYHLLITHSDEREQEEKDDIEVLVARQVDGLVIASAQHGAETLASIRQPYVLIDRQVAGINGNYVGSCDEELGLLATEHLAEQGCVRIAHLRGRPSSTSEARLAGYCAALRRRGLALDPALVVDAGYDDVAGYRAMSVLLQRGEGPDGVFCFNDPVATGAMRAIFESGLSAPEDIALIGAANMRYSDMLRVPLSTIDQNAATIGEAAGRLLLNLMGSAQPLPPRQILVPVELRARASSLRRGSQAPN